MKRVVVSSKFYEVNLQERYFSGGLGVDGKTILEWTLKNTLNLVVSTQERNYWRALVNVALNLRVP